MTPEEAWSAFKPNVEALRVFGCVAYAHVPVEKRKKFDDKSEKCIFIGYSDRTKRYKLFNPKTSTVIISRDVEFLEHEEWNWTHKKFEDMGIHLLEDSDVVEKEVAVPQQQSISPVPHLSEATRRSTRNRVCQPVYKIM